MRGEDLKQVIRNSGFPFSEVARRIGLTRQELHGKMQVQSVKSDLVEQVAKAIGVDVATLYGLVARAPRSEAVPTLLGQEVHAEGEGEAQEESRAVMRARYDAEIAFYQAQIRSMQAQIERLLGIIERVQGEG